MARYSGPNERAFLGVLPPGRGFIWGVAPNNLPKIASHEVNGPAQPRRGWAIRATARCTYVQRVYTGVARVTHVRAPQRGHVRARHVPVCGRRPHVPKNVRSIARAFPLRGNARARTGAPTPLKGGRGTLIRSPGPPKGGPGLLVTYARSLGRGSSPPKGGSPLPNSLALSHDISHPSGVRYRAKGPSGPYEGRGLRLTPPPGELGSACPGQLAFGQEALRANQGRFTSRRLVDRLRGTVGAEGDQDTGPLHWPEGPMSGP